MGEGRRQLEYELSLNTSGFKHLRHNFNSFPLLSWLGSMSLLSTAATAAILYETALSGIVWLLLVIALPLVVAVSQLVSDMLSEATTRFRIPRPLPRMNFSDGIPDASATMVAIPCMLNSRENLDALLTRLEVCWLGNQDNNLCFALLTDFADSASENSDENRALLNQAMAETQSLNRRYPSSRQRFYLLHRSPEWNASQGIWMGYERKRGNWRC